MKQSRKITIVKVLFTLLCLPVTGLSLLSSVFAFGIIDGVSPVGVGAMKGYAVGFAMLMPLIAQAFLVTSLLVGCELHVRRFVGLITPIWLVPPFIVWFVIAGPFETVKLMAMTTAYLWAWWCLADPKRNLSQQIGA